MGKVEIKVKFGNLQEAKSDLERVASTVEARKLDIHFSKAEGEAADELIALAERLNTYGHAFAKVVRCTAEKLNYTSSTFQEADASLRY